MTSTKRKPLHESVPRTPLANLKFRKKVLTECRDKATRKQILVACRRDPLFWINTFVYTFDPRKKNKVIPFCTYAVQDEAVTTTVKAIRDGADLSAKKSRDMGASWIFVTVPDWFAIFEEYCSFLMISRKKQLVDNPGDPDSLFWKLDFIHQNLPPWMLAASDLDRRELHCGFLRTGSVIDGDTTTSTAGVGGRRLAMFIDEFSRIEQGHDLLNATRDTTRCRIFNFTPWGGTTSAAFKVDNNQRIRKVVLPWWRHPEKAAGLYCFQKGKEGEEGRLDFLDPNYPNAAAYPEIPDCDGNLSPYPFVLDGKQRSIWYDAECRERTPQDVAQNLDMDWLGAMSQLFDKGELDGLKESFAMEPLAVGELRFEPDSLRPLGFVATAKGSVRMWCPLDANGRPPRGRRYVAGADISVGSGNSNSCLSVIDCQTGEKVLEMTTPFLRPEQFADRCVAVLRWFAAGDDNPKLIWEAQGPGVVFGSKVMEAGYSSVYYRTNELSLAKKQSDTPGWYPTPVNKRSVLEDYRIALKNGEVINRSELALDECLCFVYMPNGGIEHSATMDEADPTGARQNHGDRVIADALATKLYRDNRGSARTQTIEEFAPNSIAGRWAQQQKRARGNDEW